MAQNWKIYYQKYQKIEHFRSQKRNLNWKEQGSKDVYSDLASLDCGPLTDRFLSLNPLKGNYDASKKKKTLKKKEKLALKKQKEKLLGWGGMGITTGDTEIVKRQRHEKVVVFSNCFTVEEVSFSEHKLNYFCVITLVFVPFRIRHFRAIYVFEWLWSFWEKLSYSYDFEVFETSNGSKCVLYIWFRNT